MKNLLLILLPLGFLACKENEPNLDELRASLRTHCLFQQKNTHQTSDSMKVEIQRVQTELDSLSQGLSAAKIQKITTQLPECVELYKLRQKSPRPPKKVEYIEVN